MKKIRGTTAVVTGGGTGIGRSIALALANAGANVVIADIEEDVAKAVAAEVAGCGVGSLGVKTDVSKLEEVQSLADEAYGKFKSVEILCNNAGINLRPKRAHWDTTYEDWQWVMGVNFWGVVHGHMAFVPRMLKSQGEKHIVNTSSMASLIDLAGQSSYSASKAAVDGLSNSAREELKHFNIGVSVLHPGSVRTRIGTSARLKPEQYRSAQRSVKAWSDYVAALTNSTGPTVAEPEVDPDIASDLMQFITPKYVGTFVLEGILKNKPHITTHPLPMDKIQARFDGILGSVPTFPN